jgi:hypothetical protein
VTDEEWYSKKDLFEKIEAVSVRMGELTTDLQLTQRDLQATRDDMRKYNELRGQLAACQTDISALKQQAVGKASVGRGIREWLPAILVMVGIIIPWLRELIKP